MNDNELFEQARRRVQGKIKGRSVTNKDVIVEQEKEIMYYRKRIQTIMESKKEYNKIDGISMKIDLEVNEAINELNTVKQLLINIEEKKEKK